MRRAGARGIQSFSISGGTYARQTHRFPIYMQGESHEGICADHDIGPADNSSEYGAGTRPLFHARLELPGCRGRRSDRGRDDGKTLLACYRMRRLHRPLPRPGDHRWRALSLLIDRACRTTTSDAPTLPGAFRKLLVDPPSGSFDHDPEQGDRRPPDRSDGRAGTLGAHLHRPGREDLLRGPPVARTESPDGP